MGQDSYQQSRLAVLLFTDIEGSASLKQKAGPQAYSKALARHDALFRDIVCDTPGASIINDTGDGFLGSFSAVSDAINAALRFQYALKRSDSQELQLRTRVGIHLGQINEVEEAPGERPKVVGLAADIAARVMSLATGSQILLTRAAFDDGRQFVRQHPPVASDVPPPPVRWIAHGQYLFEGIEEPLEIFEVGSEGIAPLVVPESRGKAKRCVPHDEEPTLGWRPAVGAEIPGRPGWILQRRLGEGGFGEVWLGSQRQLGEQRVFKFCFDVARLRSLKREITLFRHIRDRLGDRPDIARLHEVKLDEPPFFLESEYTEGGNLREWAERQGGISQIAFATRLQIVLAVAEAVSAAHSVGILHKDIKPSNILIDTRDGTPHPRLADFGVGTISDRRLLQGAKFTVTGFTQPTMEDSSRAGTPLYAPPELLEGQPFTQQGDVYSLGVLLYQMVIGNLDRPLWQGWERNVEDPLLRDDIASCVEGDTKRRLKTANELVFRLRQLPQRREEWAEAEAERRKKKEEEWARLRAASTPWYQKVSLRVRLAMLVLALVLGIAATAYYANRPDPAFQRQWDVLVDAHQNWYRIFTDEELHRRLPPEFGSSIDLVNNSEAQGIVIDPMELVGKVRSEEIKANLPSGRVGRAHARQSMELAKTIQNQVLDRLRQPSLDHLDATAVTQALEEQARTAVARYRDRGWINVAQHLNRQMSKASGESRIDYLLKVVGLLQQSPTLESIEKDWDSIQNLMAAAAIDDQAGTQFHAYIRISALTDLDADGAVLPQELSQNLRMLVSELRDPVRFAELRRSLPDQR